MKKIFIFFTILFVFTSASAGSMKECDSKSCKAYFQKFEKQAKRGHGRAIAMLGEFYYHGYGVDKDHDKALNYYKKAAQKGITSAEYKTGLIYLINNEFKNVNKGIAYLKKAARADYKEALFLLGRIYLTQEFKVQNLELADFYLAKAYKQKHTNMPETLTYIMNTYSSIDELTFPSLHKAAEDEPLAFSDNKLQWQDDGMERITINSAKLETIFDIQLKGFKNDNKSLGSRLPGASCEKTVGCYTGSLRDLGDIVF